MELVRYVHRFDETNLYIVVYLTYSMINNQDHEYTCTTCKPNMVLDKMIEFEQNNKNTYIPPRLRKTKPYGITFTDTKGDTMYEWHMEKGQKHNWFNQGKAEADFRAIKKLEQMLDSKPTI